MSTKPSRMVADRVAISKTVISAIEIHGPEIGPQLEKILFPEGAPKELTVAAFVAALGASLGRHVDAMVNADKSHTTELADDDGYRNTRDELIVDMRSYLTSLRTNFTGNYSPEVANAYGLGATPPEDAAGLLNLAGKVEDLLRKRPLTEKPKRASLTIDPIAAADDVKAAAGELSTALSNVEREKREAQLTLGAKNESLTKWAVGYQGIADTTSSLLYLGGRPDLADHVKPTARRRAGLPEAEDVPGGEATPAPAAAPT